MKPKDDGRLAFPRVLEHDHCWGTDPGMTLRQWLAGQAVVGIMPPPRSSRGIDWAKNIAIDAVILADAVIAELDAD